jgi:hypothetical protein
MTDNDAKLAAFFAAAEPPARDYAFTAEVMDKVARRKLVEDMAGLSLISLLGAVILWALWPSFAPVIRDLSHALAPVAGAVLVVMVLSLAVTGKLFFGLTSRT